MFYLLFSFSLSFPSCLFVIEPPKGVTYYEYSLNESQTICFYSGKYFYVMIHSFRYTVISADYVKKKGSGSSLKSIYFDSLNSSATNPFIDFGNYSGVVGVSAKKPTTVRLETIVLDEKCQNEITVTNSATDTFVIYPETNHQCVFPFPKCNSLSVNFFPTFPNNNGNIMVYESPNEVPHTITANYQKDYTNPFYFIVNIDKRTSESYVLFTYTGTGCIKGTRRISTQVSTFDQRLRTPLSNGALAAIVICSLVVVVVIAIVIVYIVIKKRHLQENSETEDIEKDNNNKELTDSYNQFSSESLEDQSNPELDYLKSNNNYDSKIFNENYEEFSSDSDFITVEPIIDDTPSYFYQK